MNAYQIFFRMTSGETRNTVLYAESVEQVEEMLLKDGRPFKTFFSQEDKERKSFSINLYNLNAIDYVLVDPQERNTELHLDYDTFFSTADSFIIERILDEIVDNELIATSLRNANDDIKLKILVNASDERKYMLDEADDALGIVRDSDIKIAQQHILDKVARLAREGKIALPD